MPTTANRLSALTNPTDRERAARHARSVRPIVTAATLALLDDFIRIKRDGVGDDDGGGSSSSSSAPPSAPERRLYGGDRYRPDDDDVNMNDGEVDETRTPRLRRATTNNFFNHHRGKNKKAVAALVFRLLRDRPWVFMNAGDDYMLRDDGDGAGGRRGRGGFDAVGTDAETPPLTLDRTLSYDEMALAALMGVAVPTDFINTGGRFNSAVTAAAAESSENSHDDFTRRGVYVALVGARFERRGVMEAAHMLVDPEVNTIANGYGPPSSSSTSSSSSMLRAWARVYKAPGGYLPTWDEAVSEANANGGRGRFLPVSAPRAGPSRLKPVGHRQVFLDTVVYTERIAVCAEILLTEAEARGAAAAAAATEGATSGAAAAAAVAAVTKIGAYVHVVGLGLGVWQVCNEQRRLSLDAWVRAIRTHLSLPHVTDIDFSWWGPYSDDPPAEMHSWHGLPTVGVLTGEPGTPAELNRVRVHFSRRDPADWLPPGKVLVASYAWDGNAYPGNEYWIGSLTGSGDPAAACCSHICELQNPLINPMLGDPCPPADPIIHARGRGTTGSNFTSTAGGTGETGVTGVGLRGVAKSLHIAAGDGSLAPLSSLKSTWDQV